MKTKDIKQSWGILPFYQNCRRKRMFQPQLCWMVFGVSLILSGSILRAERAGLQTKFSMVTLENLQPGETYNTRELVNLPLVVRNTGETKTTIQVDILKPSISKSMAENGYEAIPSTSWVRLGQNEFDIAAGESYGTDVILKIPDEDQYLNKRYQVDLHIRSVGRQFINVALMSNLRFTIAGRRLTLEELERRKKVAAYGNKVEFDLLPAKATVEDIPLGKDVDLDMEKKMTLKISNPNDIDFTYYLDTLQFAQLELPMLDGYTAFPDLSVVRLEKKEVTVPANSIKKVKVILKIPDQPFYHDKHFAFAIKATVSGTPVELNQVSRFYISTQK